MILFASDLDNTLIYSYKKQFENRICVEKKDGKELSFMTKTAHSRLQEIARDYCFIPVTTRSLEQYQRITLFHHGYPEYAVTSNGGVLLVNNVPDPLWENETREMIEKSMEELHLAVQLLQDDIDVTMEVRLVDGMFVFTKTDCMERTREVLKNKLDLEKVFIGENGTKIYVLPNGLNKGTAVERLRTRFAPEQIIAAGDSSFDIPMLKAADISFFSEKQDVAFTEELLFYLEQNKKGVDKQTNRV